MPIKKPLDPRAVINLAVVVLAVFVFLLAGSSAWHAYEDYCAARDAVLVNEIVDGTIRASGLEAVERGITSAALGTRRALPRSLTADIHRVRQQGDARWRTVLGHARRLSEKRPDSVGLSGAIEETLSAYASLQAARDTADFHIANGNGAQAGGAWIVAITGFIDANTQLRDAALAAIPLPVEITEINHTLKRWLWTASEYAGRERGILSLYVGARLPLSPALIEELRSYRSVVVHQLGLVRPLRLKADVDPRIGRSIEAMELNFLGDYEGVRTQAYAHGHDGKYALSSRDWLEKSTQAIDSILAIAVAVSKVSEERMESIMRRANRGLGLHLGALIMTLGLVVVALTKVRETAASLFRQKELAEVTLHSIGDAVITTDAQSNVEYINPIAEELTGYTTSEARGKPLKSIFNIVNGLTREAAPNPIEICLREQRIVGLENNTILLRPDGKEVAIEDSAAPIRDMQKQIVGAVMVFYDVTATHQTPHLLSYHATHDPLTRLINRREFERRLTELLVRAKNQGEQHVLCYMDLDQFKVVNDTCGHMAGDKLLGQVSYLLQNRVRESDIMGRLGGDEFGLLLEHCPLEKAMQIVDGLRQVVKDFRFVWEDKTFELSMSIGMVPISQNSISPAELLSEADAACFAAKDNGRNCIQVYEPGNVELARRHGEMQWVSRITDALKLDRFCLCCQPIQAMSGSDELHGEFLIRMLDEKGGHIPPMTFIPAAERYNLMPDIDRWVIRNALSILGEYQAANGRRPVLCNINISGASLADAGLREYVLDQFAKYDINPQSVCFEITETAAVANFEQAMDFISTLRDTGCKFALDDFGSGLSSFVYLKNLPVDFLKIDGSLIQGVADDAVAYGMVQAIHRVGRIMGIKTIAEYVSNNNILEKLRELDIDYVQGFAIAEPHPARQVLFAP